MDTYPQPLRGQRLIPAFLGSFAKSLVSQGVRAGIREAQRSASDDSNSRDTHIVSIEGRRQASATLSVRPSTREKDEPASDTDQNKQEPTGPTGAGEQSWLDYAKGFGKKFGNDWAMNLCSMLAYNFLGAIFPLLLGILALAALVLPPPLLHQIGTGLNGAIPSAANGQNGLNMDFNTILDSFRKASGLAAIISFLALLWTGSSLFGVMENCFSIIFRTKDRDFVWQKLMSIAMIVIFAILTPLSFVASSISGSAQRLSQGLAPVPGLGVILAAGGYVIGVAFAFALFFLIFLIVPNVKIAPGHAWRGALVAGILFEAATLAFPIYTAHMGKSQFGAIAGLLAVLMLWFWVISLILVIGAEVNSYFALGQRATADDLPGVIHGMKVHGEMRRGRDASPPEHQERVMEDVQPTAEKKRMSES